MVYLNVQAWTSFCSLEKALYVSCGMKVAAGSTTVLSGWWEWFILVVRLLHTGWTDNDMLFCLMSLDWLCITCSYVWISLGLLWASGHISQEERSWIARIIRKGILLLQLWPAPSHCWLLVLCLLSCICRWNVQGSDEPCRATYVQGLKNL